MATLTKQAHDASSLNSATRFRYGAPQRSENHGFFASPTESEFSEHYETKQFARQWDEERVAEWLRSINCAQYVELFLVNNINGTCLVELDRDHLRDMGIKKIGDQIRIASQIKRFRNAEMSRFSKRQTNRESLIALDNVSFTSLSSNGTSSSPKPRSKTSLQDKRNSRLIELPGDSIMGYGQRTGSRPSSPYIDDHRNRSQKYIGMSPPQRNETHPASASSTNGKPPLSAASIRGGYGYPPRSASTPAETPQTARFNIQSHVRASPSFDQSASQAAILPPDKPYIRVIYDTGKASVVNIDGWKSIEDVMIKALRKGALNEAHGKNYCFYVLDGTEANSALCRKINDDEVRRICSDLTRAERSRLILRKIHMGEPDEEQLRTAVSIALQQQSQQTHNVVIPTNGKNRSKIEQLTGEPLPPISYPLSPASARQRQQEYATQQRAMRLAEPSKILAVRQRKMKELFGGRPPSELIASDLATYFPDHDKGEIDRTVRQSIRRSRRISRAASRLSTVSNFSIASSLRDAPPLPAISDAWLNGANQSKVLRPLSVLRLGGPGYRDSITSSVLEPLDEESPLESDRKSFASAYSPGTSEVAVTDPEGVTTLKSYYNDDGGSSIANSSMSGDTEGEDSLNKRLSRMVHEDSEESDEELSEYLETSSWDNIRYMKGSLIGKGSFGSVYLALHAVTGELMAVKQVEIPADETDQHSERKKNMLTALKHEISLLRELKHPNIVQYLGSNSDDTHLNIFLEYVPGGSVATMLVNYGPLGESLISNFVRQILTGLEYLHERDIIHRDIKGANILVDNKGSVKISDFGISKRVDVSQLSAAEAGPATKATKALNRVSLQGSVFWMAPEVVRQTSYTLKADIWSLGCLIIEMFTGVHPHPNMSQLQAIFKIGSSRGGDAAPEIPEGVSADLDEFLQRTFEMEWEKRPGAKELRQTRWVLGAAASV